MLNSSSEIFGTVGLISIFFLLLVTIIIITAILYHTRKRIHKIEVSNFQAILLQSQLEVQEQTMQTIGADLHDNIGQLLSLTSLTLNSIEMEDAKAKKKVDTAIDLTLRSIKELRQLGKLLQGDQLLALGLAEAIRYEIEWVERSGKFEVAYVVDGDMRMGGNTDKDLIVFRILQEALNNIIKHSAASRINIKLEYRDEKLHLHINDNGIGFDTEGSSAGQQGMGLYNFHKRAGIIGGEVSIRSKPGEGTGITIIIPYT